jgi:pentatricopeptide repeat protein
MSSENHLNADVSTIAGYLKPIVADVGVVAMFSFCYVVWKYVNKLKATKQIIEGEEGNTIFEFKKEKSDKWTNAKTLPRFNYLIQSNKDKSMDAFKILQQMQKNNLVPDIHTYNGLIDMSFQLNQSQTARKLFEEIKDFTSPVQADIVTYNILIKGIVEEVKRCKELKELTNKLEEEFIEEIKKLIEEMIEKNHQKNLVTYNTLIDAYVELGRIDSAWEIYSSLNGDIKPDVYTYSTLIKGLKTISINKENEENLLRALTLLEKVESNECVDEVKADDILYNSVIDITIRYGKMDKAEEIFKRMKIKMIKPSIITYSIMIKGYGNVNKLQSAINMFQELREMQIKPNEILYGTLLNTASKCNRIDIMTEIYDNMIKDNIHPNHVIYSQMIKAHSKVKNFSKAFEIFESIPEEIKNEANIILYNIILDSYADAEEYEKLFHLYEEMKMKMEKIESFPRFNVITYSTVIKGLAKSKKLKEAKELYCYLKENAFNLDEILFNTVCDAFAKAGEIEMALMVLDDMKNLKIKRDSVIYAIILKMYSNQLNEEKAVQIFNEMKSEGIKPNLVVYTTLMQMYIKKKKLMQAISVFQDLKNDNITPDTVTYNFIINGCTFNQKLESGIEFLLEALRNKTRLSIETYKNVLEYLLNNKFMKVKDRIFHATEILKELKINNIKINDDLNGRIGKLIYNKPQNTSINKENYNNFNRKFV